MLLFETANLLKTKNFLRIAFFGFCFIGLGPLLKAQLSGYNLVPDSSFENTPDISQMNPCNGIPDTFNVHSNIWKNPTDGTPDMFSRKYLKEGTARLPHIVKLNQAHCNGNTIYTNNFIDFVLDVKSGSNCVILSYSPSSFNGVITSSFYEYIQSPLKIVKGHKYVLGASVFFLPNSEYEYPSLDFKFSNNSIKNVYGRREYLKPRYTQFKEEMVPNVRFLSNRYSLQDSTGWIRVQQHFRPDSAYQYLTLGYFGADSIRRTLFDSIRKDVATIALDDIFVYEVPGIVAPNNICEGEDIQISSTLSGVHTWHINGVQQTTTDSFFDWKAINTSTIIAKGRYGADTLTITVNPKPILQPIEDVAFCKGSSMEIVPSVDLLGTYALNNEQKNSPFTINRAGEYQVVFTSDLGCQDSSNFTATVYDLPPPLPSSIEWCKLFSPNDSILLNSQYQYFFDSLEVQDYYRFTKYGAFNYQIINKNSCRVEGSSVIVNDCQGKIYIPNAFRPSGVNKVFAPFVGIEGNHILTIYNTWGEKIHESIGLKPSWDGICKHNDVCIGGWYLYTLKLSTGQDLSGSVYLIDDIEQN